MKTAVRPVIAVRASGYSKRPAFASLYAVAGRFILIEASDPQSAELVQHYFSTWHVEAVTQFEKDLRADATISITAGADPPESPKDLESFEAAGDGICRTDDQTYFFEANGSVVRALRPSSQSVEAWIGNNDRAREPAALARLVFNAAMTALRRCGLFELHSAGVVDSAGAGVLIIGPSGSGKSTLATQLALAGWQYLSDDALLLSVNNQTVETRALRRVFALTEKSLSSTEFIDLGSLATEPKPFDPLKRRFEPQAVFPGRFVESCTPRALFFSRITSDPTSETRRLSAAETMTRLIRMCPWACYDKPVAEAHLSALAQLARQARGYDLFAGNDLLGDANYSASYLSGAMNGK